MCDEEKTCGTCLYFGWGHNTTKWCKHPAHPYPILKWGMACPEWVYLAEKAIPPGSPPFWPTPVGNEQLKELPDV